MLSEGRKTVSATAPQDGTVYIYDDTSHANVYSGRVNSGDRIRLDAEENKVMLNDNVALQKDLINDHRYQIFFDKKQMTEADVAKYRQPNNNTTIVTPQQQPAGTYAQPAQPAGTYAQPAPAPAPAQPSTTPPAANIYVQPAQPAPAQPAQPAIPPAPAPGSGQTVVQPDGTTVVTPPAR
jgi:hypothetical protein